MQSYQIKNTPPRAPQALRGPVNLKVGLCSIATWNTPAKKP